MDDTKLKSKLIVKLLCTYIGFIIINLYADLRQDMDIFLCDYPDIFLGSLMISLTKWIFPAAFVLFGLLGRKSLELFREERQQFKEGYGKYLYILAFQCVFSLIYFYIIWHIMFYTPSYPSSLDQDLFMKAFLGYCGITFATLGILTSDELKEMIEEKARRLFT